MDQFNDFLNYSLFTIGNFNVSVKSFAVPLFSMWLAVFLAGRLRKVLANRILVKTSMTQGTRQSVATIVQYIIVSIAAYIIIQNLGINISSLGTLVSALTVGIGFGLQNIVNNFISGLIILIEQPIKVGDRVQVTDILGDVVKIGARSTHITDNNNITIIVPNSKFISDNVINWTITERLIRFKIPLTVQSSTDLDEAERLLLEVADEEAEVLKNPPPSLRLMAFGENGLDLEMRVWSTSLLSRKGLLTSKLNRAIYNKFRKHNISFANPKRDITIVNPPNDKS